MSSYTPQQLAEIQTATLGVADYFSRFCKEQGLVCYLCGGGCIGALREGGFIPWDDDLDFFMPREDYNRLYELWINHADHRRYEIMRPGITAFDSNSFTTIKDSETTLIKDYQVDYDIPHGAGIDIFPLDGYPKSRLKRLWQLYWGYIYMLYSTSIIPQKYGGFVRFVASCLLKLVPSTARRVKISQKAERRMSRYRWEDCDSITELCAGPKYMFKRYPKSVFQGVEYHKFNSIKLPLMSGAHEYLTIAFGDYMTPPPEEQRVPIHDSVYTDCKTPYRNYKGRFYCVEEK